MNIGYHYTTLENWNKIKVEGLKPHIPIECDQPGISVNNSDLRKSFNGTIPKCIWVWKYTMTQPTHLGTLLFQLLRESSFEICVISVKYKNRAILKPTILKPFQEHMYFHNGELGTWKYHNEVPFQLLRFPIHPKNLRLVQSFDFIELTKLNKD